jgi:hypothetical protein
MQVALNSEKKLGSRIARLAAAVAFALVIGAFGVGQAHAAHGGGGGGHGGGGGGYPDYYDGPQPYYYGDGPEYSYPPPQGVPLFFGL